MKPLPPQACVFDLDGTLVDSLADIAAALNECLALLGLPTHPIGAYRYMVGEGVPKLAERAVGQTAPHLVGRLGELARARYRTRVTQHSRPYPGVPELVAALAGFGLPLAVLSNKPRDMTGRVVRHFWPAGPFAAIVGYEEEEYRKPHPRNLKQLCEQLGSGPTTTWMIGDTPTDVATAQAAGAVAIGVTWGFRTRADLAAAGADHIIDTPQELLTLL